MTTDAAELPRAARRWPGRGPGAVGNRLLPLIVPAALLALWAIAAHRGWMSAQVLPPPSLVWETARELWADGLLPNLGISLRRLALGLAGGALAGIALGWLMGSGRRAEAAIYPTFLALVQIPTLAWIPLLMMVFGLGEALKIAVILKAVATPVAMQVHVGVRDCDQRLAEAATVLRLSPWQRLRRLTLPASLPALMTGLRLGLAQGWTSLLAVELLASAEGIGFLVVWGRQLFQLDIVFVCIAVIGLVGLVMDRAVQVADNALLRWPRPATAERQGAARRLPGLPWIWLPLALLGLWWTIARVGAVDANFLPSPAVVLSTLAEGLLDGRLPAALAVSLKRYLLGALLGIGVGLATGLALGLLPVAGRLFDGTLTMLRLVAIFAWLPLLTAWTGIGEAAKVIFIALACFFPMQVAVQRGVINLPARLAEAATVLRLGPVQRLRYFVLPGAAPAIFAGLRLALAIAWIGTIGAEYFMTSGGGIGSLMINAQQLFRMDVVMSTMILIGAAAAAIGWAGRLVEARATRWRAA
ncbi:MAG: ABC transporter permease [Alphaproteobacteria bacterium]|nr:ABC transporter permease [Alphaproteobacteria bacterium]